MVISALRRRFRKRQSRKAFRVIAVLEPTKQHAQMSYSFTKNKTVVKELKTTIQHRDIIINTYPLHLYINNVKQKNIQQNGLHEHFITQKIGNLHYHEVLHIADLSLHDFVKHRLFEERRYYQSHPYLARQLALSYLHSSVLQDAIKSHLQTITVPITNFHQPTPFMHKGFLNKQLLKIMQEQVIDALNEKRIKEEHTQKALPIDIAHISSPAIYEEQFIQKICKEVLRRWKQEQKRKGW